MWCPLRKGQLVSSIDDFQLDQGEPEQVLLSCVIEIMEMGSACSGMEATSMSEYIMTRASEDFSALPQILGFLTKMGPQACC